MIVTGNREPFMKAWISTITFALLILGTVLGRPAIAQGTQQFMGRVADASGAVIPGATVTVHNEETGIDVVLKATSVGDYTAPYLKPGNYTISASMTGFQEVNKTHIHLDIDQTSRIDFSLPVGEATTTVTVVSDAQQIDFTKGDRGEIIDGERVQELPLDGRNPFMLFGLSPGTHNFESLQYQRPFDLVTHQLYANGSPQVAELNIDGVTNEAGGTSGAAGYVPSVDVLGEYKVVLNPYDASYSHGGGNSIDLSLKSGSNAFHGTAGYFYRRSWLDAVPWSNKYSASLNGTTPLKPQHKRDQFSVEGSGPVTIPHLYNGKDKLFYVVAYEELKDLLPSSTVTESIPNPAWSNGDFSTAQFEYTPPNTAKVNLCGTGVTQCLQPLYIYDPLTPLHSYVDPLDGLTKMAHAQFNGSYTPSTAGNIIPQGRIDSVGQAILNTYKFVTPNNNPGVGFAPYQNNYIFTPVEDDLWRNALIKIDWKVRPNDALSFRWGAQARYNNSGAGLTGLPLTDPATEAGPQVQPKSQTGAIQWTHTFGPTLVFNFSTTLITEVEVASDYGLKFANESAALGFSPAYYNQLSNNNRFPNVAISGYTTLSSNTQGSSRNFHTLQFLPTITDIRGAHTFRAGIDVRFEQNDNPGGGTNDQYGFTGNFTNHFFGTPGDPSNYTSGSGPASLLLGYPNSGSTYNNLHSFYSQHYFAPWAQDDWRLSRRLTLNLGLRWDFLTPLVERHNKIETGFNLTATNPASAQIPAGTAALGTATSLQGGVLFAGVNGQSRGAYVMNKLQVQPRIGFAYAITDRMVLRGGIGANYLNDQSTDSTDGFSASTTYTNSLNGGLTPYTSTTGQGFSDPLATIIQPNGNSLGLLQDLDKGISFYNHNYHVPILWNYSLTYEAQLTKRDTISLAYVGNRVPNGAVTNNINNTTPQYNAQCDLERGGTPVPCSSPANQIANPFLGLSAFAGTGFYNSTTISKQQFTMPFPEFGTINENGATNNQRTWYNSFQAVATHNVSRSLSLHLTYTKARDESAGGWNDELNNVLSRTVSTTNDVAHAINFSGVGYLPFGQGRTYFSNANRFVDTVINGWGIAPSYTWYSGFPWRPGGNWEMNNQASPALAGGISQSLGAPRVTLPLDGNHSYHRIRGATPCVGARDGNVAGKINTASATVLAAEGCPAVPLFVTAAAYAVGRNTIDFGVRQPGAYTLNMEISKNINLPDAQKIFRSEAARMRLAVDLLNAFNHANWDEGYNGSATSIDFGTISKGPSAPTNVPRYLQLSAKIDW